MCNIIIILLAKKLHHNKKLTISAHLTLINTYIPISIAGSVSSSDLSSSNLATHTTIVLLYSGRAVMVSVSTKLLLPSWVVPGVMSGGGLRPSRSLFTLHLMISAVW